MSDERNQFPEHFTFSQRNGHVELPEPMRLEYLSEDLRRELYDKIRDFLHIKDIGFTYLNYGQIKFISSDFTKNIVVKIAKITKDEVPMNFYQAIKHIKYAILKEKFYKTLDCLEIIINESSRIWKEKPPYKELDDTSKRFIFFSLSYEKERYFHNSIAHKSNMFKYKVIELFNKYDSAYQLNISQYPCRFYPRANKEQGEATQQAIETVRQGRMDGAATHLRQAAEHINMGQCADSVADSIHAVESVARTIDPNDGDSLGKALKSLEDDGLLKHKALKQAFMKLYGYTSDEQGIRHALLDQNSADVGLDEAIFMFGACASFTAYLTRKHQQQTKT